jgi:hypothetical protein
VTVSRDEMDAHWSGPTHWLEMKDAADRMQAFREAVRLARQIERERIAQFLEEYADAAGGWSVAPTARELARLIRELPDLPDRESK